MENGFKWDERGSHVLLYEVSWNVVTFKSDAKLGEGARNPEQLMVTIGYQGKLHYMCALLLSADLEGSGLL